MDHHSPRLKPNPSHLYDQPHFSLLSTSFNSRLVGAISDIPAVHPGGLPLFINGPWTAYVKNTPLLIYGPGTAYVEKLLYSSMIPGQLM